MNSQAARARKLLPVPVPRLNAVTNVVVVDLYVR